MEWRDALEKSLSLIRVLDRPDETRPVRVGLQIVRPPAQRDGMGKTNMLQEQEDASLSKGLGRKRTRRGGFEFSSREQVQKRQRKDRKHYDVRKSGIWETLADAGSPAYIAERSVDPGEMNGSLCECSRVSGT